MFEVTIFRTDQREIPLPRGSRYPRIGCRDYSAGSTALGHNVSPRRTSCFVCKQRRAEIDVLFQFVTPCMAPSVESRPEQKLTASHERYEPLVAASDLEAPPVESVVRLK
jgi:hypothetical protein